MPSGAQGPLGLLRASQMVQQLLPGGIVQPMPQEEEEKKPQFIAEMQKNDFPVPVIALCKLMHGSSTI